MSRVMWLLLVLLVLMYGVAGDMEYRDRQAVESSDVHAAEVVARW